MSKHTERLRQGVDFDGVILIEQLGKLLGMHAETIRGQMRDGIFPIPPLPRRQGHRYRWSGPVVRRYLETNGRELEETSDV